MDKCVFLNAGAHLGAAQLCAPAPAAAVAPAGIKPAHPPPMWITARLCQNCPQSCARPLGVPPFHPKRGSSACWISASSYIFHSEQHRHGWHGRRGQHSGQKAAAPRVGRKPFGRVVGRAGVVSAQGEESRQPGAARGASGRCSARAELGFWLFFYSFIDK